MGESDKNYLNSGFVTFEFINSSEDLVVMNAWLDSSLRAVELRFPPTGDDWKTFAVGLQEAHQLSITATGEGGPIGIRNVQYYWQTAPGFDELLEVGECPVQPLPGVGDPDPQPPTALIKIKTWECAPWVSYDPIATSISQNIEFDARDSADPNIEQLEYVWDFKDGTTATGAQAVHTYAEPGFYFVELTATDASGQSDKDIIQIQVRKSDSSNNQPIPVITSNRTNLLRPFTTTTLWGDVSYDIDGDAIEHVWYTSFSEEPVYGPEINIDVSDSLEPRHNVWLGLLDSRGGLNYRRQLINVADYPGQDCEVTYRKYSSNDFSVEVKLYNNTSSPVHDWRASWHTDAEVFNLSVNQAAPVSPAAPKDTYSLVASDSRSFSVTGNPIPEYSWAAFRVSGETSAELQEIGFQPQDGMVCIEHRPQLEIQSAASSNVDKSGR